VIIKVSREQSYTKFIRVGITALMTIGIFLYLYFHIVGQTIEDNKAFEKKIVKKKTDKIKGRKLQRFILNETESIITLIGAKKIHEIKFQKKYLYISVANESLMRPLKARYNGISKLEKTNTIWTIVIDMEKLVKIKKNEKI
jgi:hypothetical protein